MLFQEKSTSDIVKSLEGEIAKALSEIQCADRDLKQAQARMKFLLAAIHYLKEDLKI